jgi:transposase
MRNLKKEIELIDREIDRLVAADEVMREREALLRSTPGVGKIVARTLIAFVPELGALSRRQIASLVGVAPFKPGQRHDEGAKDDLGRAGQCARRALHGCARRRPT